MLGGDILIIDVNRLNAGVIEYINIDQFVRIDDESLKKANILALKDTKVEGTISKSEDDYYLDCSIKGLMVHPCSLTLEPVDYPFNIKVEGIVGQMLEEIGEFSKNAQNSIDILPIIWENILMEIPMKVISPTAKVKTEGNGWRIITEEDNNESINPELEKLRDLL